MTSRGDGPRRGREAALGHVSPAGACPPATAAAALPTVSFRRDFRKRTRSFFDKERRLATRTAPPTGRSRPQPAQHRGPGRAGARSSRVTFLPASVPNTLSPAKGPSLVAVVTTSLGASPSHSSLRNSARRSPLSPEHAAREAAVRVLSTLSASATERESQAVLPALLRGRCGKARSRAACRKDGRQRSGCSRHSRRRTRPGRAHIWMASAGSGRVSAATLAICHSQYVRLF